MRSSSQADRVQRGEEIEITLEKFADRGKSIAYVDGYVVFVAGGAPGDHVRARVFKRTKKFAEARIVEVLAPSALRVKPRCYYFGSCGGCSWQHVSYEAQLEAKKRSVEEALRHHGGLLDIEVRNPIGADSSYFYRNKMEFSFSAHRWLTPKEIATQERFDKGFALGLHAPGNFFKVLDLKECHLQSELSVALVNGLRQFARDRQWLPWNIRRHEGFLRHLVVRHAQHTDDVMVNLVTNGHDADRMAEAAAYLRAEHPPVTTFVNTVHTGPAQTAHGEETRTIFGAGVIHDRIGKYRFEIAPHAFFQTNTLQAERLYRVVRQEANLGKNDLVYDLYCGAGTISLFVASDARHVVGIERVRESVSSARANAAFNGVDNCTFVAGAMEQALTGTFVDAHGKPDVIIVDPPRAGMHKKVVARLASLRPERIIYVSCNPISQARDLALLRDAYVPEVAQPVDLFPHTHHIENVVRLQAKTSSAWPRKHSSPAAQDL